MPTIIGTVVLVLITIVVIVSLLIPSCRRTKYGKFMVKALWIPFILVVLSCLFTWIVFAREIPLMKQSELESSFIEYLDEYLSIQLRKRPSKEYYVDNIIVLDKTNARFATEISTQIPPSLLADSPETVRIVVWLERMTVTVGQYTDGNWARRVDYKVTIIDKTDCVVIDTITIKGDPPDKSKTSWETGVGSSPISKVVDYLKSFPKYLKATDNTEVRK